MGMDFLDVSFRIEKTFGFQVTQGEFFELIEDRDMLVCDLYNLILQKLHLQEKLRSSYSLNLFFWRDMQVALGDVTDVSTEEITLPARLEKLFPKEGRRDRWRELQAASLYQVRELDYPAYVRVVSLLLTCFVTYAEFSHLWWFAAVPWLWPILGLLGLWMLAESHLKVLKILSPLRTSLPSGLHTVKDLCRDIIGKNTEDICLAAGVEINGQRVDDRCLVVWQQLVKILVEALGVDADEITYQTWLVKDLDMS